MASFEKTSKIVRLIKKYNKCPQCGSTVDGDNKGTVLVCAEKEFYRRTCACGFRVAVGNEKEIAEAAEKLLGDGDG